MKKVRHHSADLDFYMQDDEEFEDTIFFGVETEMEFCDADDDEYDIDDYYDLRCEDAEDCSERLYRKYDDFLYLKDDSSLREPNIEVNFSPMSYRFIKEEGFENGFLTPFFRLANQYSARADDTNTCGTHVHVGTKGMTRKQYINMLMFFIDRQNESFLFDVSMRGSHQFRQWCSCGDGSGVWCPEDAQDKLKNILLFESCSGTKYSHITSPYYGGSNCDIYGGFRKEHLVNDRKNIAHSYMCDESQMNSRTFNEAHFGTVRGGQQSYSHNTIEVRIFNGTVVPSTWLSCVEFCKALVDFALVQPFSQMNHRDFVSFIKSNCGEMQALNNRLAYCGFGG